MAVAGSASSNSDLHQPPGASTECPSQHERKPNIIFILTDDQDLLMSSLEYMPHTQKHLLKEGTLYQKHFCTTSICCPARVSLLTGRLSHNTNVTDVAPPYGKYWPNPYDGLSWMRGYPKFISEGLNDAYLPIWLQQAGYDTYYTGKLFNAHDVTNYNKPFAKGWTENEFLLDPFTYDYFNPSYQHNQEKPVQSKGQYTTDIMVEKVNGFVDKAKKSRKPFFMGIAPIAPHSDVQFSTDPNKPPQIIAPLPAKRHENLFKDAKIPRTPNFNPDKPSGVSWIKERKQLTQEQVDYLDEFYRQRLRSLQSVDELVDGLVQRLEKENLLDNTYIFYTTDNGFHLAQHRLLAGKECGFDEDINIPLIVRGPGVPKNHTTELVTAHVDIAPTFLKLAGAPNRKEFDGEAIPLSEKEIVKAAETRQEHVTVEYWGFAQIEGKLFEDPSARIPNNTYKAVRIVSDEYSFYYSVFCHNERELYDMKTDPYQINNLLAPSSKIKTLLGKPLKQVVDRLDTLVFVLKSCKAQGCIKPWHTLHPQGNVKSLADALSPRFDHFYAAQRRVSLPQCTLGYIQEREGPQFEKEGSIYRMNGV
ncbi:hypothetical protein QQS21_010299 [Conoideocrella luteorostrata]|uniref:Arylsulfatase n=1 Tax=Conoideocrella luteorostrata TaxID=1105319 RepID=A0AAJ0CJQ8_9HYPO|nr:hypothetical protein QQS21_010299 [Conoideocrella luteorostrata]